MTQDELNELIRRAVRYGVRADLDELAAEVMRISRTEAELRQLVDKMAAGLRAVKELINESDGVYGLVFASDRDHWGAIRTGGPRSEYLEPFDDALAAMVEAGMEVD